MSASSEPGLSDSPHASDSFVQWLRAAAGPSWSAAVGHRFVSELFDGSLEDGRLAAYLVQDYQFCDAFVALLGAATASAPDLASRLPFARQLGFFAADENDTSPPPSTSSGSVTVTARRRTSGP